MTIKIDYLLKCEFTSEAQALALGSYLAMIVDAAATEFKANIALLASVEAPAQPQCNAPGCAC